MNRIKQIIENNDTTFGRIFDLFIQFLIVISLLTFSIDTLPNLSPKVDLFLKYIETVTVTLFTIEYLLRVIVADNKLRFIFSFFGIIDLLAILPFYLRLGIDLRSIRSFRMLRIFRMFKLARYSKAIKRYHRAFLMVKEELILFFSCTCILLYLSAAEIYYFEGTTQPETFGSIFHSLWWAVITLTTVGYGDAYPITVGGKIFTFIILMIGLGIVAVPTGLMASALSKAREEESHEKKHQNNSI